MTEQDSKGSLAAQLKAAEYMKDFADKVFNCKDTLEYCELVTGVLIFNHLVRLHFKELHELDDADSEKTLSKLDEIAKIIADETLKASSKQKGMN